MSIRTATSNGVLTLEIARPEKKNALTFAMYEAMTQALNSAQADNTVRAVLITGQPAAFTAGNDLQDFLQQPPFAEDSPVLQFMYAVLSVEKPIVAAVTGVAVGIGVTMLLHCDFVFVSEDAQLSTPFVTLGLVPEFASSTVLPRLMGHVKAAEVLLLGKVFSGADAVKFGIANAALPTTEVVAHARRVAERFSELPAGAVRDAKRLMREGTKDEVMRAIRSETTVFAERLRSPEAKEAFEAFFQKRKPDFSKS
jgi:enoyl-CoA hydratase/carnithine racemase